MITVEQLLAEAMTWLDTPVRYSGSIKGEQVNCLGMAGGIAKELGLRQAYEAFEPYEGSGMPPEHHFLIKGLRQHLIRVPSKTPAAAGMLLLINNGGARPDATHVALCISRSKMINPGGSKVHIAPMKSVRVVEKYLIPGVDYE
jgi:cell wall-associated NlpC family hydrolase